MNRLAHSVDVPPIDPNRERALLAAFDARHARPARRATRMVWMTGAALIAAIVSLNWMVVRETPAVPAPAIDPAADLSGFVPWPGANAWPPLESGSVVRVDLPVSVLPLLGLSAPVDADVVEADVVVGQDGLARAVRLVRQP